MHDDSTTCPHCDREFWIQWVRQIPGDGDGPEYCPWCGNEFDYLENTIEGGE
jgi:uncharacterized Zn-finger protein